MTDTRSLRRDAAYEDAVPGRVAQGAAPLFGAIAFLLTATVGLLVAYDRAAAWPRYWLLVAATVLMLAVWRAGQLWGETALGVVALGCAALAGMLGAYFLLTYDWADKGAKIAAFLKVGLWIQAHRPAVPVPEDIHVNVAAAGLTLLVPLGLGGAAWAWRRGYRVLALPASLCVIGGLAIVMLAVSRSALLGLAAGAAAAAYTAWREGRGRASPWRWAGDTLVLLTGPLLVLAFWVAVAFPPVAGALATSRPIIWQHGLDLVSDYPFTGSGLGSTMMVHTSYVMLLHVGFLPHMHNLFLEIAVEQGVPGLMAFIGILGLALAGVADAVLSAAGTPPQASQPRGPVWLGRPLRMAGAACLAAIIVNGMGDVGAYATRLAPLLLLPAGFCLGLGASATGAALPLPRRLAWAIALAAALAALVLLLPGPRAAFQVNLAAVEQTRLELGVYRWPEWPIQDAVRRARTVELEPVVARYRSALALDPDNASAGRRVGQIALSLGDYDTVHALLQRSYPLAPQQRATRILLGESDIIRGDNAAALALWKTTGAQPWWSEDWLAPAALKLRAYWHEELGEREVARRMMDIIATTFPPEP